jgi:hypothetical protein
MLGVSAGLLFAIATFDLLPAALSSATQHEDEKHQHDHLGMVGFSSSSSSSSCSRSLNSSRSVLCLLLFVSCL